MNREEFCKKFAVGDKIRSETWSPEFFKVITAIGDTCFLALGTSEYPEQRWEFNEKDWLPYEEPKQTKLVSPIRTIFSEDGFEKSARLMRPAKVVLKNAKIKQKCMPPVNVGDVIENDCELTGDLFFEVDGEE